MVKTIKCNSATIKCLSCGAIHEHIIPIHCKDSRSYTCKQCKVTGNIKILRGGNNMFVEEQYCMCGNILESEELEVCKDCR